MRVRHLNCGTMRPLGGGLINGVGAPLEAARMVCHCLLIETEQGLVLVDTGLGTPDVTTATAELGRWWLRLTRPVLSTMETAAAQLVRLGYAVEDVRHVVLTHLDRDHAGGLPDFPNARVHVHATEFREATASNGSGRYLRHQWKHGPHWVVHEGVSGERWFGFEAVRDLPGLPEDILLVPLGGHTRGSAGVAVRDPGSGPERWLLHAGDAYFFHGEMDPVRPWCTPGLRAFQNLAQMEGAVRRRNRDRLRDLATAHQSRVEVFCSHDPVELDRFAAAG